ncbi:hypothetical protein WME75_41940 [Sorangium sp. So ce1014]|uniref:hypothetical protein n=1 Tax=Sorangium sp. So ce1014 TaxID=3133326 RepID=UPI003F5FD0CC
MSSKLSHAAARPCSSLAIAMSPTLYPSMRGRAHASWWGAPRRESQSRISIEQTSLHARPPPVYPSDLHVSLTSPSHALVTSLH